MKELYIHSLELQRDKIVNHQEFPFSLEVIKSLKRFKFDTKVTFLIGENGVGKSTLLEIAINYGFNPEGAAKTSCFLLLILILISIDMLVWDHLYLEHLWEL